MTDSGNSNGNGNGKSKSWAVRLGGRVSAVVSDLFAHPYMQIGVILFCIAWFAFGLQTDLLTAALSILAITLTQMVLNRQNEREADDHRRDVAMHAKLDELLIAMKGARDEMAGIEDLDEEEIVELKVQAAEIDAAGGAAGDPEERAVAKQAVKAAAENVARGAQPAKPKSGRTNGLKPRAAAGPSGD